MHPHPRENPTHRHNKIFKIQKIKDEEKFLKEIWDGGKYPTYRETKIIIIADISLGTMQARREWSQNKSGREKNHQSRKL